MPITGSSPLVQATAVHLADLRSSRAAIYASDLSRAHTTAKKVYEANKTTPKPPFTVRFPSFA